MTFGENKSIKASEMKSKEATNFHNNMGLE